MFLFIRVPDTERAEGSPRFSFAMDGRKGKTPSLTSASFKREPALALRRRRFLVFLEIAPRGQGDSKETSYRSTGQTRRLSSLVFANGSRARSRFSTTRVSIPRAAHPRFAAPLMRGKRHPILHSAAR